MVYWLLLLYPTYGTFVAEVKGVYLWEHCINHGVALEDLDARLAVRSHHSRGSRIATMSWGAIEPMVGLVSTVVYSDGWQWGWVGCFWRGETLKKGSADGCGCWLGHNV